MMWMNSTFLSQEGYGMNVGVVTLFQFLLLELNYGHGLEVKLPGNPYT